MDNVCKPLINRSEVNRFPLLHSNEQEMSADGKELVTVKQVEHQHWNVPTAMILTEQLLCIRNIGIN